MTHQTTLKFRHSENCQIVLPIIGPLENHCTTLPLSASTLIPAKQSKNQPGPISLAGHHRNLPILDQHLEHHPDRILLAGYSKKFTPSPIPGTIFKLTGLKEEENYRLMKEDEALSQHIPKLHSSHHSSTPGKISLVLENCLHYFSSSVSILDCKMGVRTFLEDTLRTARHNPELRTDLYERMVEVDPTAPTHVEHYLRKVALHRYMVWRDTITSSASLGFRVKGIRKKGVTYQHFKTVKSSKKIMKIISSFLKEYSWAAADFLQQLELLKRNLESSPFFEVHEMIGSSLLFNADQTNCKVWMIDFEKVAAVPAHVKINHQTNWSIGNHEDGYMLGLNNLIDVFRKIAK